MAAIIVNTTLDENDGSITDGDVSLRDAIAAANSGDTITFASGAGEAFEGGGTIRLREALGELVIGSDVIINGDTDNDDASRNVTIDAQGLGRVLNVTEASSRLDGLVITGGSEGGISVDEDATLAIANSSISGNGESSTFQDADDPQTFGGGIYSSGTLTLTNTTVSGNGVNRLGGGIWNEGTATLTNTRSPAIARCSRAAGSGMRAPRR